MKQVVLSIEDESDERLRRLAHALNGGRKGSLSKTVEDALLLLEKRAKQISAGKNLMALSNRDIAYGVGKFERRNAYASDRFG